MTSKTTVADIRDFVAGLSEDAWSMLLEVLKSDRAELASKPKRGRPAGSGKQVEEERVGQGIAEELNRG